MTGQTTGGPTTNPQAAAQHPAPSDSDLRRRLAAVMGELGPLPPAERLRLEGLADAAVERQDRLRQTVSGLQESLDHLRLSIKYLVFDLEATRRENQYLRRLLEETAGED